MRNAVVSCCSYITFCCLLPAKVSAASAEASLPVFPNRTSIELLSNWAEWHREAAAEEAVGQRTVRVTSQLKYAAGIYVNSTKPQHIQLSKMVMITIVTLTDRTAESYKNILRNFLCFTYHYKHKVLLYYSHDGSSGTIRTNNTAPASLVENTLRDLQLYNPYMATIDFPTALFWQLLATKQNFDGTHGAKWKLDFRGKSAGHAHFGAPLLKLVAMLEVLRSGYDCVYFDVDIAFIKDPIPLMVLGQSTVAISYESRSCASWTAAAGTLKEPYNWQPTEPNSGIFLVRVQKKNGPQSGPGKGEVFMQKMVHLMVEAHTSNDQYQIRTHAAGLYRITTDCQVPFTRSMTLGEGYGQGPHGRQMPSTGSSTAGMGSSAPARSTTATTTTTTTTTTTITATNTTTTPTTTTKTAAPTTSTPGTNTADDDIASLCYYHDILFQNGLFAFNCNKYDENTLRLNRFGRIGSPEGATTPPNSLLVDPSLRALLTPLSTGKVGGSLPSGADNDDFISPVTAHANFCDRKHQCLSDLGLWLVDHDRESSGIASTTATTTSTSTTTTTGTSTSTSASTGATTSSMCRPYDIRKTVYRQHKWYEQIRRAEAQLRDLLLFYPTGTILRFRKFSNLWIVDSGPTLRPFSTEIFTSFGLNQALDVVIPDTWESNMLHELMVVGSPLPVLGCKVAIQRTAHPPSKVDTTNATNAINATTTATTAQKPAAPTTPTAPTPTAPTATTPTASTNFPQLFELWKLNRLCV